MTSPTPPQPPSGLRVEIPKDMEALYSNLARISHSASDFLIDFAQILHGENKATVRARILMTPLNAKFLLRALTENLARYEAVFGEINIPHNPTLADNLFKPFQPPEPPEPPRE